jgi:sugar (pentulose or hexulose) kinase
VSGGGARVDVLGRIKAQLLGRAVLHLEADASANGAAMLAASAAGYGGHVAEATREVLGRARRFEPSPRMQLAMGDRRAWFDRASRSGALHRPAS